MRSVRFLAWIPFAALLFLQQACTPEKQEMAANYPPVPRLDSVLFNPNGIDTLLHSYADCTELWAQLLGQSPNEEPRHIFEQFVSDTLIRRLEDSIQHIFRGKTPDQALYTAFERLAAQLPHHPKPRLYYYNSGFQASILVADSLLAIGLDRFLGAASYFYTALGMPRYLATKMTPAYIVPTALEVWISTEFPLNNPSPTILDQMIYQGKLKYALKTLLTEFSDTIILQRPKAELEWLENAENDIWTYLSEKQLLYERNQLIVSQFTRPAPFTNAFGQKSPGEAVNWVGYRIVSSYKKHHPEVTLEQLFSDSLRNELLLQNAHYRP